MQSASPAAIPPSCRLYTLGPRRGSFCPAEPLWSPLVSVTRLTPEVLELGLRECQRKGSPLLSENSCDLGQFAFLPPQRWHEGTGLGHLWASCSGGLRLYDSQTQGSESQTTCCLSSSPRGYQHTHGGVACTLDGPRPDSPGGGEGFPSLVSEF